MLREIVLLYICISIFTSNIKSMNSDQTNMFPMWMSYDVVSYRVTTDFNVSLNNRHWTSYDIVVDRLLTYKILSIYQRFTHMQVLNINCVQLLLDQVLLQTGSNSWCSSD